MNTNTPSPAAAKPRIGFIGTGVMGRPMAANLLQAGFPLTLFTRTRSRADSLIGQGAVFADDPAAVARRSDIVITMLPDTPDVQHALTGESGIREGLARGGIVIDMSTISPQVTAELAAELSAAGLEMLDAPVSGGERGAIEGTLSIMVGGKNAVFEQCRPVLEAMGKKLVYCGESGKGQIVKLCNQIAGASTLLAAAEAVTFARKAGVDPLTMIEAVGAGAAGSWLINNLGPRMVSRDFAPGFMVKLKQKDLRLVMNAASELGVSLPGAALAHQLFRALEADGSGDLGTQALVTVLERLSGESGER